MFFLDGLKLYYIGIFPNFVDFKVTFRKLVASFKNSGKVELEKRA